MAAAADAPVLLLGEQGTGREAAARRIHETGVRAEQPFVDLHCGSMQGVPVLDVLFGRDDRQGRLELAAGGSLFLADVDRLEPADQKRLAASLVQSTDAESVRRLASARAGVSLDEELRGRLGVIEIEVPPLRARKDDLPRLAERILTDLSREYGRTPPRLSADVLAALQRHAWPGNVVEFRNLMERMLLASGGDTISPDHLPRAMGGHVADAIDLYGEFDSLQAGIDAFARHLVQRVVADCAGREAEAAQRLGVDLAELRRKLKTWG
jgi:DNA-binding NtrC family response regulator